MERAPTALTGQRFGPYRLVAPLGRGGMGEVWRAARDDGQYEQQVAIKLATQADGAASPEALERFRREQRIVAGLDHPQLAKLLDAGVAATDLPWFAMALVDGEPITRHCERAGLDLPARLRLMREVCEVVHYLHQQGIVHADLKPENLLVGATGELHLVDFGIARHIGEPAASAMTLSCASPEQVRGLPLTPASDVYALGLLLYRLLAGRSPYREQAAHALAHEVCEREPPPTGARVDRDLEAVVRKALQKEPAQRYASAQALSEELFRCLEGLPVQARSGGLHGRVRRFVLRHRSAVGAALLANLALAAGLALMVHETQRAQHQRARAEQHFANVRALGRVLIFDVHDAIQNLPGATSARKLVVEHALRYLNELSEDPSTDPAEDTGLRTEIAAGYRKVGDIQGQPFGANLGDPEGARRSYLRARELSSAAVAAAAPGTARDAAQRELVVVHKRLGALSDSLGELAQADAMLRAGIVLAQALVDAHPGEADFTSLLAAMHGQLSQLKFYAGDFPAYLQAAELEFRALSEVVRRQPDDREAVMSLSVWHDLRGQYLAQHDDSLASGRLALQSFEASMRLKQQLLDREPRNSSYMRYAASEHLNLGVTLLRVKQPAQAIAAYRRGTALLAELTRLDPDNMDARQALALASNNLSGALYEGGDLPGSARAARESIAVFESLSPGAQADVAALRIQGRSHFHLGRALSRSAPRESCEHYRRSLAILVDLQARVGLAPGQLDPAEVRAALARCGS
ncbi:serine/threonine-protein kinase [Rhizobacter sp. OV335]|uniref:serine/threonine-protein kinase n=1 Tax=Rhizobacter sp. OV335 TaxID=1500264 RepID=UPI00091AC3AF|nr:serine/threonine-protein kinase [Rhizobacter sp. OV335]SHN19586.1 serine/threonine protein kinase [Rhizobacter sp. OV335]